MHVTMVNADSWTAVLLCRDAPQDLRHIRRTIPAIMRLEPFELIVGVDDDMEADAERRIRGLVGGGGDGARKERIIRVQRSPEWKLHPMHVLWKCIQEAASDVILQVNADTVPNDRCLLGLEAVRQGAILASVREHYSTNTPVHLWRHVARRIEWKRTGDSPSGTYWMRRPDMLRLVSKKQARQITNGFDAIWFNAAGDRASLLPVVGAKIQGETQHDLVWRQWETGIWLATRTDDAHERNMEIRVVIGSCKYLRPHVWSAFRWARRHPEHPAVRAARSHDNANEWSMSSTEVMRSVPAVRDKMRGVGSGGGTSV